MAHQEITFCNVFGLCNHLVMRYTNLVYEKTVR